MLNKFSLFFRRILVIFFIFTEILLIFIILFAQKNQIWIFILMVITLILYLAINWVFKALSD